MPEGVVIRNSLQTLSVWKSLKFVVWKSWMCALVTPVLLKRYLNSLPNDKILDWSKLKAFADDIINVTEKKRNFFWKG